MIAIPQSPSDGASTFAAARSPGWPALRRAHLKLHPLCAACGSATEPDVHHVAPVHVAPARELDAGNLLTMCRPCHLVFGHLRNWSSWNTRVRSDASRFLARVRKRPMATVVPTPLAPQAQ